MVRRRAWDTRTAAAAASTRADSEAEEFSEVVARRLSYVIEETDGTLGLMCVYEATSPEAIRLHAIAAQLPVDEIVKVADTIVARPDPAAVAAREGRLMIKRTFLALLAILAAMVVPFAASAKAPKAGPGTPELLATLAGGAASGSAIGPGGALYVPQPAAGEIWRVDPKTGAKTLYASGLPRRFAPLPFGGVMDVAFYGSTAYALVRVVGASFPTDLFACHPGLIGIYRITGPTSSALVADIGSFACDNAPSGFPFVVPTGVQYALEPFKGGFLVTDGHHNRVYRVRMDGSITQLIAFGDVVPTGLAVHGNTIYLAEAGPVPHLPANGKI